MLPIEVPELYDEINDVPNSRAAHLALGPVGITITAGPIALGMMIRLATQFRSRNANAIRLRSRGTAARRHSRSCKVVEL